MKRMALFVALLLCLFVRDVRATCTTLTPSGLQTCPIGEIDSVWVPAWNNNWTILNFTWQSPLNRSGTTISINAIPLSKGGFGADLTNQLKGGIAYANAGTGAGDAGLSFVSPNQTTTKKVLKQVGNGTAVTTTQWEPEGSTLITGPSNFAVNFCPNPGDVVASNNPGAATCTNVNSLISFTDLNYSGNLIASGVHGNTASGTVAHRVEVCSAAASGNVTMTLPASPALGQVHTLVQRNATYTCSFARAGSQTLDGATTVTLSAGVAVGKGETCWYIGANDWHCEGAGT